MKKTLVIMAVFALMAGTASVANAQTGYGGGSSRSGDRRTVPTLPAQASPVAVAAVQPGRVLGASTLGLGSRGPEVVALQDYLRTAGYFKVNSTGYFGPITQAALLAYEAVNGPLDLGRVLGASTDPEKEARIAGIRSQLAAVITQLIALLRAELNSAQ